MSLSDFITSNMDAILEEWTVFAATLVPVKYKQDRNMLLDHARRLLEVIATDLATAASPFDQAEKSKVRGLRHPAPFLEATAARMRTCVRETDTVARLGGDEFTIILQDLDKIGHAEEVAKKILRQMGMPFHIKQHAIFISASIGIALAPGDADTPDELIKEADMAMYASKEAGSNRYSFYAQLRARQG